MGQATDQIVDDIDRTREELRANLEELEHRVKSAADWRHYVDRHPGAMMFAAAIGGALLSALIGRR
jgi:hypothetical protein